MLSTPARPAPPEPSGGSTPGGLAAAHPAACILSMVGIEKGGVILVAAEANITATEVDPSRRNPLETLLGANWFTNRVLLDLSRAGYIDSSAVGWLLSSHKTFREKGGALAVYGLQPAVRQLLEVLKLGRVLPLADDESAARERLAGGVK